LKPEYLINEKNGKRYFIRFSLNQRLQHILLAACVITLVLTGMPLKFHQTSWAPYLYNLFGGIHVAPIVHKVAGTILLLLFVYHLIYLGVTIFKNRILPLKRDGQLTPKSLVKTVLDLPLIPNIKDAKDIVDLLKYLLFITNQKPQGARFTWKEKFDYWAPFWGIVIIGSSGIIMWHKELVTRVLPGVVINFALIAHSDEALLAMLFLFIWHFYNVHFSLSVFPMGTVFLTGYLSEEQMIEEHYQYYTEVMKAAGLEEQIRPPDGSRPPAAATDEQALGEITESDLPGAAKLTDN
jgi:cytochrome b subunit of formate dehydrogenase